MRAITIIDGEFSFNRTARVRRTVSTHTRTGPKIEKKIKKSDAHTGGTGPHTLSHRKSNGDDVGNVEKTKATTMRSCIVGLVGICAISIPFVSFCWNAPCALLSPERDVTTRVPEQQ